jgi:hypothetical protein
MGNSGGKIVVGIARTVLKICTPIDSKAFPSEHIFRAQGRSSYFPTANIFKNNAITFGKGMERVVLGNGPKRVLVLVGIHGNEHCGVEAVKIMLQRKALFSGDADVKAQDLDVNDNWKQPMDELFDRMTVEILLGNPQAVEMNTRFVKKNLNRLFDIHMLCNDASAEEEGYINELQRAKLIAESIRCADIVLDIHSTSADVGSFALPSSMALSEQLAECLPVKYVVESLAHMTLDGGTTLDCALLHDVPGICVECGQHSHPGKCYRCSILLRESYLTTNALNLLQIRCCLPCCGCHIIISDDASLCGRWVAELRKEEGKTDSNEVRLC